MAPAAYRRFLAPFVGVSKPGIGFLRDAYTPTGGKGAAASHGTALQWEEVRQHWSSVDGSQLPAAMPDIGHAPCGILHAGKSCPHHIGSFFVSAYKRALLVRVVCLGVVTVCAALLIHFGHTHTGVRSCPHAAPANLWALQAALNATAVTAETWRWHCSLQPLLVFM